MLKKYLCAALSAVICLSAAAVVPSAQAAEVKPEPSGALAESSFGGEDNISLRVWASDKAVPLVRKQIESFKALYPGKTFKKIELTAYGEYDAATQLVNDPNTAADVMTVPSDPLNRLDYAKVISPVKFAAEVKSRDAENSVNAATYNNTLYAYPHSVDNGYYLVYDKNVVSAENAKTLEGTLEACKKAKKQFVMDCENGFYSCIFAFTGGAVIDGFESDGETQKFKDYDEETAVNTLQAFSKLMHDYKGTFVSHDPSQIASGFSNGIVGAGFDGTWNASADKSALGSRYGAAKLPAITVNNTKRQIVPMQGLKYNVVNSKSKFPNAAQMLAYYLTDEACQKQNAQQFGWTPSNKAVQNSAVVKNNALMNAMKAQAEFACPQISVQGTFWQAMGNLGVDLMSNQTNPSDRAYMRYLLNTAISDTRDEWSEFPVISHGEAAENGIALNWYPGGCCGKGYRVYRKSGNSWKGIGNTPVEMFTDSDVEFGKTYTYTVRALDSNGKPTGDYDHTGFTVKYETETPEITSLTSTANGMLIRWNQIKEDVGCYRIYYKNSNGGWSSLKSPVSGQWTYDTGIKYGETRTYTIRAVDNKGKPISRYNTAGRSAKYGVANPQITSLSSNENGVTIKWNAVTGAAKYRVYYKENGKWRAFKNDVSGTSMTDSAVSYNKSKTYTIRAVNNSGAVMSGYNSAGRTAKYAVATPQIKSLSNSSRGVVIKWSKVSGVSNYRLYYKNDKGGWSILSKSFRGDSYTDIKAKNGQKRTYTVRALDKKGNTISDYNRSGTTITCKK